MPTELQTDDELAMAVRPATAVDPSGEPDEHAEHDPGGRGARVVLGSLAVLAVVSTLGFMTIGVTGSWSFALPLRAERLAAMVVVGSAIAVSTSVFQTVTNNRILTPSIMGFDALYVLLQSVGVFVFGVAALARIPIVVHVAIEASVMVGFALVLYRWLFRRHSRDLFVLVLAGIVFGTLFRSASDLVVRLVDPNEFQTLQDRLFASFGSVDTRLLVVAAVVVVASTGVVWRLRHDLDAVALGRDVSITLGVDHHRIVSVSLAVMAVLVSVATALVGPLTFLGLLVVNLARQVLGTFHHALVLPASILLSVVMLTGGQLILEEVFGHGTAIGIVINLVGGATFLLLLLREARS